MNGLSLNLASSLGMTLKDLYLSPPKVPFYVNAADRGSVGIAVLSVGNNISFESPPPKPACNAATLSLLSREFQSHVQAWSDCGRMHSFHSDAPMTAPKRAEFCRFAQASSKGGVREPLSPLLRTLPSTLMFAFLHINSLATSHSPVCRRMVH